MNQVEGTRLRRASPPRWRRIAPTASPASSARDSACWGKLREAGFAGDLRPTIRRAVAASMGALTGPTRQPPGPGPAAAWWPRG